MAEISRTKKVLALSLGGTFNSIAFIASSVVAARLLEKHDYATIKQTMLIYSFLSPLLMLGLSNALFYYLPKEKERKKGVIIDTLFLIFIMAFLFSLFLSLGGYRVIAHYFDNPDLLITLKWMIPYPFFIMPATILGAVLLVQNKTYVLTLYNVTSNFLLVSFIISGVLITYSYTGPLIAHLYFPLLLLPIALWLTFKYVPGNFSLPKIDKMIEILKYSVPLGLASFMGVIMLQTDKLIVSSMCTPEEFANYVNGAIEIPLIGIVTGSIASIILVDMVKYIDDGNKTKALELFKKASVKSAVILFPVMIFLLIAGKVFIVTLYSEKYLESVIPFYIYLFVLPVRIVVYGSALMALGQSKTILYRSIVDIIVNIILSIVLVKLFGYIGAAIATILTLYIWTVPFNLYKIGQGFSVKTLDTLPFSDITKVMSLSVLASPLAITYIIFNDNAWVIQLFVASVLYFPLAGFLLYKFNFFEIPRKYYRYIPNLLIKGE